MEVVFDLLELDTLSPYLDMGVYSAHIFKGALTVVPDKIARPVDKTSPIALQFRNIPRESDRKS